MGYAIYHSSTFDLELEKMPRDFQVWVDKIEDQLVITPYVGDPLRVPWFREKKKDKHRIYYLIYENLKAVYMVGISAKNDQQAVINSIWLLIDNFKEEMKKLVKN